MLDFLFSFNPGSVLLWIIIMVILLLYVLGRYYFFEKIGVSGWKGLIPVYSNYLYYEKGHVHSLLSIVFICLYFILYIVGEYFVVDSRLSIIVFLFKSIVVMISSIVTWNASFYISNKLKNGYLLTFLLTFIPFLTIPFIGLCDKFSWSRLKKVDCNFLLKDYYFGKKVSISDVCTSSVLLVLSTIISFYLFIYVASSLFSVEKAYEIMWDFKFIIILLFFVIVFIVGGIVLNYFLNKNFLNREK